MLSPVLSGFVVVDRRSLAGLMLSSSGASTRWALAMHDVRESMGRLWELFEFTAAAGAIYDRSPQRLGRRVQLEDPY